ncbi:hypothetical protein ZWY2020_015251 [Hordeum vulgare]|nr:hypothetical protein ZWY2020_015251 [Hordeum vulgare]
MAAAAPSDRLSDLPDDLLIHVLSFAPSREAARTTALSRRWRRLLWLHSAALNLDYRSYATTTPGGVPLSWRAMDDADHAIAFQNSVGRVPTKVAVVMRDGTMHDDILSAACSREDDDASGVLELRIECLQRQCTHAALSRWSYYGLSIGLLPYAALHALELIGCKLKGRRRVLDFPCLEAMRLRRCVVDLDTPQSMVDAAPGLSDLHLDALSLRFVPDRAIYRLRCSAVTVFAMANVREFTKTDMYSGGRCSVELDAPVTSGTRRSSPSTAPPSPSRPLLHTWSTCISSSKKQ